MILLKSGMFDAFEIIGGTAQSRNNRQLALWGDARAEGVDIPVVGSSDVHRIKNASSFPNNYTVCFAKSRSEDDILAAVKAGFSVAVEGQGYEYDRRYRAYGKLRFAHSDNYIMHKVLVRDIPDGRKVKQPGVF